jgi:hypothetical protein
VSALLALGILAAATGIGVIAASWSPSSDLVGKSASQVLQGSLRAAVAQGSAEVTEQVSALGALKIRAVFDLNVNTGKQVLAAGPLGTATLLEVQGAAYVRASASFLSSSLDMSNAQAKALANRWIVFQQGDAGYLKVAQDGTLGSLLGDIGPKGRLALGHPTIINGVSVVGISGQSGAGSGSQARGREVLYVSTTAPNLPVEIVLHATEDGVVGSSIDIRFSHWGQPVSIEPPIGAVLPPIGAGVPKPAPTPDLSIPAAAGYTTFAGPGGKPMAVGQPWGKACKAMVFAVSPSVPDTVYEQVQMVVGEARTDGVDVTIENRQLAWDPADLYPANLTTTEVEFVGIFANATSSPTLSDDQPEHIELDWNARPAADGSHEILTSLNGTLYLKNLGGSPAAVRLAIRQLIAFSQGIGSSSTPGSGIARGSTVDAFSPDDIAAMQIMSGCHFEPTT